MISVVRVVSKADTDPIGAATLADARSLGIAGKLASVRVVKVFRLEGLEKSAAEQFALKAGLVEFGQQSTYNCPVQMGATAVYEIGRKPGVTNPETDSILRTARDLGFGELVAASVSHEYHFFAEGVTTADIDEIVDALHLVNPTVGHIITEEPKTLLITGVCPPMRTIPIRSMTDLKLVALSLAGELALDLTEMRAIKDHFTELGRDPTDAEVETIAQTWSEHCKHKTFTANLRVDGVACEPMFDRLRNVSRMYFGDLVVSAFADNAGVMTAYDGFAFTAKVETHNHPSSVEPYGGAGTGIGGVIRDTLGTGLGAKPMLSTDIFCLQPPDMPTELVPPGCLPPLHMVRGVVSGVRDYGNRMGIPTGDGALIVHPDFVKPAVIVGSFGLTEVKYAKKGSPLPGDRIIVIGGATGRDGVHGATVSSGEMTDKTAKVAATTVQIGNPIEEKRVLDALLICRDAGKIRAVTDCGAGGFSSAIGEMGSSIGAHVYLERAPLKYPGLARFEIWVSEAQERMVLAVAPENVEDVLRICRENNVPATNLGMFTATGRLVVTYNDETVCDLSMEFLHHGVPQRNLIATDPRRVVNREAPALPTDWGAAFKAVLSHPNVASREAYVRQYDHQVQGAMVLTPFTGVEYDGPSDAAVIAPVFGKKWGGVFSHGLNPILNRIDPYRGSICAAVEAIGKLVAAGGNFREACLVDNFIWPRLDDEAILWDLYQSLQACLDVMHAFKRPFISGKDSLGGTYQSEDRTIKIRIPPVLCVSAFGRIPDVGATCSTDFKDAYSTILLVGRPDYTSMGGSVYHQTRGYGEKGTVPTCDLMGLPKLFDQVRSLIEDGTFKSVHHVDKGGILTAVFEMCVGGRVGARLSGPWGGSASWEQRLFNETPGCFVVEVDSEYYNHQGLLFGQIPHEVIGSTTRLQHLEACQGDGTDSIINLPLEDLITVWKKPMKEVFHA